MRTLAIVLAALLAAAGAAPAQVPAPVPAAPGQIACLFDISGTVEIRKAGETAWQVTTKGRPVAQGDSLRTSKGSWCEILFKEGSFIKIDENSESSAETLLTTASERNFAFYFKKGKALWMVMKQGGKKTSKFSIRTPTAVCAVRGTDFSILVAPSGETSLGLFEGEVSLEGAGGEKILQAGHEAVAGIEQLGTKDRFSGQMRGEERRYQRIKKRVEALRKRLAEREDFIDDFVNRQRKTLSDFESRRQGKLKKR